MDGEHADQPANHAVDRASQRIGTMDRQAAVDALSQHARAGRLTAQEYEDRSESAKRAVTWGDVDQLFADLPQPHPEPVSSSASHRIEPLGSQPSSSRVPQRSESRPGDVEAGQGLVPPQVGNWLMALTPPLALILFFVFDTWWFFLLIPVVSMVVYGPRERRR